MKKVKRSTFKVLFYLKKNAPKSQTAYLRYSLIKTPNSTPINVAITIAKSEISKCSAVRCRKNGASSRRRVIKFTNVLMY